MTICKQCGDEFNQPRYKKMFCDRSCAASFNGSRKLPRSSESRNKTSTTIREKIKSGTLKLSPLAPINRISEYPFTRLYGIHGCNACGKSFWQRAYRQQCCTTECVDSIRSQNKCRKTQIEYFNKNEGKIVILQSSWEVKIAEWLDLNQVIWHRPSTRIKWFDVTQNKMRTYLPDFYIVEHNFYLDVKNPIKMKEDGDKISQLVSILPLFVGNIQQVEEYVVRRIGFKPTCVR